MSGPKAVVIWEQSWGTWLSFPKNTTPPAASSRGSCLSARSRGEADIFLDLRLLQSSISSLCANPSSLQAHTCRQSPHYQLPLTDHLSKTPVSDEQSLDDLSIHTQHPALTPLTFQSTVTFISTSPSPSLLSLPTRPCLHPLKLESSHPGFQL